MDSDLKMFFIQRICQTLDEQLLDLASEQAVLEPKLWSTKQYENLLVLEDCLRVVSCLLAMQWFKHEGFLPKVLPSIIGLFQATKKFQECNWTSVKHRLACALANAFYNNDGNSDCIDSALLSSQSDLFGMIMETAGHLVDIPDETLHTHLVRGLANGFSFASGLPSQAEVYDLLS